MWKSILSAGMNLILRACLGFICIYLVHIFAAGTIWEDMVGINFITLTTSAVLGIPGIALLYGYVAFCKLLL